MQSLWDRAWPLSEGDWKVEVGEVTENYPMEEGDLEVLQVF